MTRIFIAMVFAIGLAVPAAFAQGQPLAWLQIEAQPTLARAQASLRRYAAQLQDVNGFTLRRGGWYAIVLGPYAPSDAARALQVYKAEGAIPGDSYISRTSDYRQQFWPVGVNALTQPALVVPDVTPEVEAVAEAEPEADTQNQVVLAEPDVTTEPEAQQPRRETLREARAGEAQLSAEERAEMQVALNWAGFYNGPIDAAFGRGTRQSIAKWQEAYSFAPTGVMTSLQRAELFRQYNAVLDGLDLQYLRDASAGIEMKLPTGVVGFTKYEPPFAHYGPTADIDAKVLLISQPGTQDTLAGLYDIMQTLEIVPEAGPRTLDTDRFTLIGEGALTISHTQAWLKDGAIKGFTLVWPAGDEERRARVLSEMQASFATFPGTLNPAAGSNEDQHIDLVAGLEVRKPLLTRSGFYVDDTGTVVTPTDVAQGCGRITIDESYEAQMTFSDDALGVAVLRPITPLAPGSVARFQSTVPRLQSGLAVAGYSYGGILGAPTLTFGQLADLRGLNGEEELKRLALAPLEGDAGGPVVDTGGAVLGMLLPAPRSGRTLPDGVSFALDAQALQQVLTRAGVTSNQTSALDQIAPETLTRRTANMTVLVSCWE